MEKEGIKIIANNKKASYEYFLSDFLECGIVLQGTQKNAAVWRLSQDKER